MIWNRTVLSSSKCGDSSVVQNNWPVLPAVTRIRRFNTAASSPRTLTRGRTRYGSGPGNPAEQARLRAGASRRCRWLAANRPAIDEFEGDLFDQPGQAAHGAVVQAVGSHPRATVLVHPHRQITVAGVVAPAGFVPLLDVDPLAQRRLVHINFGGPADVRDQDDPLFAGRVFDFHRQHRAAMRGSEDLPTVLTVILESCPHLDGHRLGIAAGQLQHGFDDLMRREDPEHFWPSIASI
jgi:hypothetical protein